MFTSCQEIEDIHYCMNLIQKNHMKMYYVQTEVFNAELRNFVDVWNRDRERMLQN